MGRHEKLAKDCWALIKALGEFEMDADLNAAALNLIELACDAAAEGERRASGLPPRATPQAIAASFTCPTCGWRSYNQHDIEHGYCGHCHTFREPEQP